MIQLSQTPVKLVVVSKSLVSDSDSDFGQCPSGGSGDEEKRLLNQSVKKRKTNWEDNFDSDSDSMEFKGF